MCKTGAYERLKYWPIEKSDRKSTVSGPIMDTGFLIQFYDRSCVRLHLNILLLTN